MLYEQRTVEPERKRGRPAASRLWRPKKLRRFKVSSSDTYLSIDDRDVGEVGKHVANLLIAVASPWPHVDRDGRLTFQTASAEESTQVLSLPEVEFTNALDRARKSHRQLPRDIRVGDAFWVRNANWTLLTWTDIIDITAAARDSAKIALYSAVAPKLDREEARSIDLSADPRRPTPPPGPTASPAV